MQCGIVLLLALLATPTSFAVAQQPSAFPAIRSQEEVERLRRALSQALDRIADLEAKQKAADEAIVALRDERDAAQKLIEAAKLERESLERSVAIAERAIAAQQKAIEIYEKAIQVQAGIIEKQTARVDKLEDKLDRANSRTVKAGLGGFAIGIVTSLLKIF